MYTSTLVASLVFALALVSQAKPIAHLEARKSMSGDATYYDVGLGSCGESNSNNDMVAALSKDLMGGDNSYCGQKISIKGDSGSVSVKVVDTCPSCDKGSIDLSPAAFKKLGDLGEGRIPITWSM